MSRTRFHSRTIKWSSRSMNSDGEKSSSERSPKFAILRTRHDLRASLSLSCMSIKFLSQENNAEWGIANRIEAASLLITCRYLFDRITEEREHYNAASADCNFATRSGGFPPRWKCRLVAQLINRSIAYAKPFARAWFYSCAWIDR